MFNISYLQSLASWSAAKFGFQETGNREPGPWPVWSWELWPFRTREVGSPEVFNVEPINNISLVVVDSYPFWSYADILIFVTYIREPRYFC